MTGRRRWYVRCLDAQADRPHVTLGTFLTRTAAEHSLARWQRRYPSSLTRYYIDTEVLAD